MPEVVADPDDGGLLVGVVTVLRDDLPRYRRQVVMGSGAGYKKLPADISNPSWTIRAVRGPLTAKLLGLPAEVAVVDPAALLPKMPDWLGGQSDPIFVPHWETAYRPVWKKAAQDAGLRWVDPRGDAHTVIQKIASARLVVAESMHAAIIADAFRVPWLPVIGTHSSIFKWRDWAASLGLEYRPQTVGPWGKTETFLSSLKGFVDIERAPGAGSEESSKYPTWKTLTMRAMRYSVNRLPERVARMSIAGGLRSAMAQQPYLSSGKVLAAKQDILLARIEQLREDYAAGRIV